MQSLAARQALRRCGPRSGGRFAPAAVLAQNRSNSFIKTVMDQVKKEVENDPKMKKDWEKVQQTSKRMAEKGTTMEERVSDLGESLKSMTSKTTEAFSSFKDKASSSMGVASSSMSQATEQNESLKKAAETFKKAAEVGSEGSSKVLGKGKTAFTNVMDYSSKVFDFIGDADKKGVKTKEWKKNQDAAASAADFAKARAEAQKAEAEAKGESTEEIKAAPTETAVVVSEARSSSWERFGGRLGDMPFLSSVFENPLFDRFFGESEIAASIKEMKEMDYTFHLEEFTEDMEYIVAPHIIGSFLEGNSEELQKHCGEAAFASVNASIKAREQQKLMLDPSILAGPKELSLISAKLNDKGPPSFIWTFTMQQVNCLTDDKGEIIEGAVDDIRNVCYAMAINRHPDIDKPEVGLEYPWQVSELAILWNQPCF